MITFDSTYLTIGIASFLVIAVYMVEHENASRAYKGLLKKPYAQHFDGMFIFIFFSVIVLFAYLSLVAAIYCALRLLKGWFGFSILSNGDKRKLDSEIIKQRRQDSIEVMLGNFPFNGGLDNTGGIPSGATYEQAMAFIAIWLADNYADKANLGEQIEHCKRFWLSLRYSPINGGKPDDPSADFLASRLPSQVEGYFGFLESQDSHSTEYWPNVESYVVTKLQAR